MTIRLVIESAPHTQAVTERVFDGGRMVIGRSDDADWTLNDPDMFLSRQHCILTERDGRVMAMDASSGGLFIDNAANPVGPSNAVPVEPGMRLRMGDFVLRVEAVSGAVEGPRADSPAPPSGRMRFEFGPDPDEPPPAPPPEKPADLPDPFGLARSDQSRERRRPSAQPRPLDQDEPFALDLRKAFSDPAPSRPARESSGGGRGYFDDPAPSRDAPPGWDAPPARESTPFREAAPPRETPMFHETAPEAAPPPDAPPDLFADWSDPSADPAEERAVPEPGPQPEARPETPPDARPAPPEPVAPARNIFGLGDTSEARPAPEPPTAPEPPPPPVPASMPREARPAVTASDADLRDALLRGMGLDPAQFEGDPIRQAEQIGRTTRQLVEGVMMLLRSRAEAKQKARVAQTIIARSDVNPLKFLASPEDVLAGFIEPRGRGYLGADDAVTEAFRDLTDHQLRTWTALQAALRRMIDKFDPDEIEKAMENVGLLESLIAGGRSAKLWRLYQDRYREIARAAEDRFLGEVGADFRDAYEEERRRKDVPSD